MNFFLIANLITGVFIVLGYERLLSMFFEKRKSSLFVLVLSYVFFYMVANAFLLPITTPMEAIPWLGLIINILIIFALTFHYESTMKRRLVAASCAVTLFIAIDLFILLLMGFQDISLTERDVTMYDTWGMVAMPVVFYVVVLMLRRLKNIKRNTIHLPIVWASLIIIPISSLFMLILSQMYFPLVMAILFTILIIGVNVLLFYLHDILSAAYAGKLKSALHTQEKEYYFTQCQLMQESAEKVKSIRHDMKLHLATTRHYIANHKADEAMEYLNNLVGDINDSEIYSGTGNIAFDSIINFKLKNAIDDDIKLDIDVRVPSALNIEASDVVIILGNLLDNALDAVANIEEKFIRLNVEFNQGTLFIRVDNSFDGEVQYADSQNGTEQVIATRKDGDNHGYGLKNIQKSIEKYDGNMDISHEGNLFSVGVLLYIK